MVLSIVGLGLGDVEDITIKGFKAIKDADIVYLEIYTSFLINSDKHKLEEYYGKEIKEVDRIFVEEQNDTLLNEAKDKNVALLIAGDPFRYPLTPLSSLTTYPYIYYPYATTHVEIYYKAMNSGINVNVIHNASILNSVGITGLQLYRFGETVSIPFFEENWKPFSFYDKIMQNYNNNLHTLCLLDIKVRERSVENIMKNKLIFEEPSYLLPVIYNFEFGIFPYYSNINMNTVTHYHNYYYNFTIILRFKIGKIDFMVIGIARLSSEDQIIKSGKLEDLLNFDFGPPLHSLIVCSPHLHHYEQLFFNHYS
ncbi:diphtine synthase, putative [Theileria annulata]|uniref:diphthine methyl ester synthase n=1 Tax=Theileria annulata TaxID=5874 RepID=Q4UHG5_THEAN|nr:diphtine synthase, putative [Theileria annulata]CAI73474.1 diphtine synthase, putative [Theileria annulata]|eukprot:XP_954151.1 diphtine synthase, putative [Theileria annulata]